MLRLRDADEPVGHADGDDGSHDDHRRHDDERRLRGIADGNRRALPVADRSSFAATSARARAALPLTLTITVVNVNNACSPVANAVVDIWQCDAEGNYSQYSQPGYNGTAQTFLRGIQTTDAADRSTFTTVYPGWYQGRATHIHVEVTVNSRSVKVTQIAFPESVNAAVYATRRLRAHGAEPHVERERHGVRGQPVVGAGHDHGRRHHERVHGGIHGGNQRINGDRSARLANKRLWPGRPAIRKQRPRVSSRAAAPYDCSRRRRCAPTLEVRCQSPFRRPPRPPSPSPRAQPAQNTPRILVVEDDAKMRRVLELLLSGHWTVETAADAALRHHRRARAAARPRPHRPPPARHGRLRLPAPAPRGGGDAHPARDRDLRASPRRRTASRRWRRAPTTT